MGSRSVVADRGLQPLVAHAGAHGDAAARFGVREGVAHEVAHHLGEPVRIGFEYAVDRFDANAFAELGVCAADLAHDLFESKLMASIAIEL